MQPPPAKTTAASSRRRATATLFAVLMLAIGTNAIVQPNKQQSSQRSEDPSAFSTNHQQSGPIPAGASASSAQQQQQQPSSASGANQNQPQSSSYGISAAQPGVNYANSNGNTNQKPMSTYMDSMASAASNPEQSYQAAAQSVNMALANSGILSNGQQQQSSSGASASPSTLNPLHYFYYPAAKESIQGPSKQADAMANSASNQYQTYANVNYNDPYQPASYVNQAGPDVAASSHEASYMPQPVDGQAQGQPQAQQSQQQQQQQQPPQQPHNFVASDLASYASNQMQQTQQPQSQQQQQQQQQTAPQSSVISFGGPASQPGASQNQPGSNINDYLNSHMAGGHLQQQQQSQGAASGGASTYQQNAQNMFHQLASGNDLSTSNFGNNGGMSSIASYMAPNGLSNNNQNNGAHDLFGNGMFGNQFSPAASQLSPSSVTPPAGPQQPQQSQQQASSLYPSSLYGSQQQQQVGVQAQQQQPSAGNLFDSALNSNSYPFLTAQQYSQLTGQPLGALASEHSPLSIASAISAQQQQQQQQLQAPLVSGSSTAPTSSKRFGLGSFIMPVLALAGLSLLIPTMSNLGTAAVGRRKRSIVEERASSANRQQQIAFEPLLNGAGQLLKEGSLSEYMDRIERYYGIYRNAVESDECRNRLICEFGDAIKDIGGKGPVMSIIEHLVPSWMAGKMHLFKEAAMNNREGKEKCKMYACKNVDGSRQGL